MQHKIIYRFASLFIAVSLLLGSNLAVHASSQSAPAQSSAVTFNPVADAYVIQPSGTSNYGSSSSLRVDGSPVARSYMRFVVNGLNGAAIQSAVLRIYANSASATGLSVQAEANNSWTENQITYSNAPTPGNTIISA